MKRKLPAILTAIVLVLSMALTLTACQSTRTPISAEVFQQKAEAVGFVVQDISDTFEETSGVNAVKIALKDNYQVEFYDVDSVQQARDAFAQNKEVFEGAKGNVSSYSSFTGNNYAYYIQTSAGNYSVISQIENTFIYVNAPDSVKKDAESFIKSLGY